MVLKFTLSNKLYIILAVYDASDAYIDFIFLDIFSVDLGLYIVGNEMIQLIWYSLALLFTIFSTGQDPISSNKDTQFRIATIATELDK